MEQEKEFRNYRYEKGKNSGGVKYIGRYELNRMCASKSWGAQYAVQPNLWGKGKGDQAFLTISLQIKICRKKCEEKVKKRYKRQRGTKHSLQYHFR